MTKSNQITASIVIVIFTIALTSCGFIGNSIVGKWQNDASSSDTIEFRSDGTLSEKTLLRNINGSYTSLGGGKIKMNTEGMLWGTNETVLNYSVSGDKLTLTSEGAVGITMHWTRLK